MTTGRQMETAADEPQREFDGIESFFAKVYSFLSLEADRLLSS